MSCLHILIVTGIVQGQTHYWENNADVCEQMLKDMMPSNFKPEINNKSQKPFLRAALIGNNDLSKHLKSKVTLVFKIEDADCAKGFF